MDLSGVFQLWGAKPMRGCVSDCVCVCLSPLNFSDWLDIHLFSFLSLHLQSPRLSLLGSFPLISYHISFHYSTGESCWGTKSLFLFWKLACFCQQKVKLFFPPLDFRWCTLHQGVIFCFHFREQNSCTVMFQLRRFYLGVRLPQRSLLYIS